MRISRREEMSSLKCARHTDGMFRVRGIAVEQMRDAHKGPVHEGRQRREFIHKLINQLTVAQSAA